MDMDFILFAVCLLCFMCSLFSDNINASKYFNYVGLSILIIYVFLVR
jgi:hypothetical protein